MNCIVCGDKIEEGEDIIIVSTDRDFMHKRCKPLWKRFKDRMNNITDAEFRKHLSGELLTESEDLKCLDFCMQRKSKKIW